MTLIALISTLVVASAIFMRLPYDSGWLSRYYGVDASLVAAAYIVLAVALAAVTIFTPRIERLLADGKTTALIVFAALQVSIFVALLNLPTQAQRIRTYPFTIGMVSLHLTLLAALAVIFVLRIAPPHRYLKRYAILLAGIFAAALVFFQVASVGRFIEYDMPDEAWFGSQMLAVAQTGRIVTPLANDLYGNPDAITPRIFVLTGLWMRLVTPVLNDPVMALRSFSLLVGLIATAITAAALWRSPHVPRAGWWIGLALLLGWTVTLRATHQLRPDYGMFLYGALLLAGLTAYWRHRRWQILLLLGLALCVGIESIPTAGLTAGGIVGVVIVAEAALRAWRSTDRRLIAVLQPTLAYGIGCAVAAGLYVAWHVLPNTVIATSSYDQVIGAYSRGGSLGARDFLSSYLDLLWLNLSLAPLELIVIGLALVRLVTSRQAVDRWLAIILVLITVSMPMFLSSTHGYFSVVVPIVIYGAARACQRRLVMAALAFALLPAMASLMIKDMAVDIHQNDNARYAAELDLLTWRIPEGSTVVADADFWLTLRENRVLYSWQGFSANRNALRVGDADAFLLLGVDYLICRDDGAILLSRCLRVYPGTYAEPFEFNITNANYLVFERIR